MGKNKILITLGLLIVICFGACQKEIRDEISEVFIGFKNPIHFPETTYNFDKNPITEKGFELGRRLFYDVKLSRNNTISCGSCHIQSSGFTHHGHDVSHGIDDRLGRRNAPPIMNLAWSTSFNWDGGVFDLDLQPIAPITAHEEMDETMENVLGKLRSDHQYPGLFKSAFGSEEISTAHFLKALSQFMLLAISSHSKYDSVTNQLGASYTSLEKEGYLIFKEKCNTCHKEPLFTDHSFRNNGIGKGYNGDEGRFEVTQNPEDRFKFRVPSLRNLRFTAPYMHDGRLYTLAAVLDQYDEFTKNEDNLDPFLKQGDRIGIPLSAQEKESLLAFLNTLNDRSFIDNRMLSE